MVTRPPTRTSVHTRVSFAKGGKSIILNPKHDPIARPATTTGTSPAHNTRPRTSSMVKIIQSNRPPSIQPSVVSNEGLQYTPSPSPVPNTNPPTPLMPISTLPIPDLPIPEPATGQTIILSKESSPIEEWVPTPRHSPVASDNPILNYYNPTLKPDNTFPIDVVDGSRRPDNNLERSVFEANIFSKSATFLNTLAQVDTGIPGGIRQQSKPLPNSHVPDERRVHPIPIPNPLSNSEVAINSLMQNLNVVLRRQEYSISQNLVQLENLNSNIVDVEFNQHNMESKIDQNTESISKFSEDLSNFRKSLGKSRAEPSQPLYDSHSSDILEEIRKLFSNVMSLVSQFGSMQKTISNWESRFSNSHSEGTFNVPTAPQVPLPTPNPPLPNPFQNNPFNPVTDDTRPKPSSTSVDKDAKVMEEYNLNYSSNLDEGHIWFSDKVISLGGQVITAWARVVSMGQWGQVQPDRSVYTVRYTANTQRKKQFLLQSIRQAFGPNGYYNFPLPPSGPVLTGNILDSTRFYSWITWSGIGDLKNLRKKTGPIRVAYPPNRGPNTIQYKDFVPSNSPSSTTATFTTIPSPTINTVPTPAQPPAVQPPVQPPPPFIPPPIPSSSEEYYEDR